MDFIRRSISRFLPLLGVILACYTIACRYSIRLADFYTLHIYPYISDALSRLSSVTAWPLQGIAIALLVGFLVLILYMGFSRRWKTGRCLKYVFVTLLWTYVWFYMGWCTNYYRSPLSIRTGTPPTQYDETDFRHFLEDFSEQANAAWTADTLQDKALLEKEIKAFYAQVPRSYGLTAPRAWHHPKTMAISALYSSTGVQGFMAPLFAESFVNADLLSKEYPFVYAHEYAHILSVSNEAEANWWAFHACCASQIPAVRYSGYKSILPHVIVNAIQFLPKKEYRNWLSHIRHEVLNDLKASHDHWDAMRSPTLDKVQGHIYDLFLNSNHIPSGQKNYSEVVQLLISQPAPHN